MEGNDQNSDIKIIVLPETVKQKKEKEKKPKRNREITKHSVWTNNIDENKDLDEKGQRDMLNEIWNQSDKSKMIQKLIRQKIEGYKSQDVHKNLFDSSQFINLDEVVDKLENCQLKCFYCREQTLLLYALAHDQKQWTLERIDNSFGHNRNNVEIACLSCNIKRRTMYYEKYRFTKQVVWEKQL